MPTDSTQLLKRCGIREHVKMTDKQQPTTRRRALVGVGTLLATVSNAGCTVTIGDHEITVFDGEGGSPREADGTTPSTPTSEETPTLEPTEEYGGHGYGEDGYGGVDP